MAAMAVNPRSQASTATGQCLQRYLAATMMLVRSTGLPKISLNIVDRVFPSVFHDNIMEVDRFTEAE